MPVIFAHRLASSEVGSMGRIDTMAFDVSRRSGARATPACASLAPALDARGLTAPVTPLEDGPGLVLAFRYAPADLSTDCPSETQEVVVVAWAGGVTPIEGRTDEDHRTMDTVETEARPVTRDALADLGGSLVGERLP
jgi:hypothetical protein